MKWLVLELCKALSPPHYEPAIAHVAAAAWEVWLDIKAARHAVWYRHPEPCRLLLRSKILIWVGITVLLYREVGHSDEKGGVRHEVLGEGGEVREHILGHNEINNEDGEASEFIYLKRPG